MSSSDPSSAYWLDAEDWHTAGEPFRIVERLPTGHLPTGATVAERRAVVLETESHPLDVLRRTLCHEPRGHGDMYGGFITPPNDSGAHFGVLFWHKDGFSTACGHGTIALGCWAVSNGLVEVPKEHGSVHVLIDVPSGRVMASVRVENGRPVYTDFVNIASYVLTDKIPLTIPSLKNDIHVQFSYGGACYGFVDAKEFGMPVVPSNVQEFVRLCREIKGLIGDEALGVSMQLDVYGIIFFQDESEEMDKTTGTIRERNITVFADGQVDRSPCGSGTCARLAIHFNNGNIRAEYGKFLNSSLIGTSFEGDCVPGEQPSVGEHPACIPRVRGKANLVGRMKFFIDPADPVYPGFLLQ